MVSIITKSSAFKVTLETLSIMIIQPSRVIISFKVFILIIHFEHCYKCKFECIVSGYQGFHTIEADAIAALDELSSDPHHSGGYIDRQEPGQKAKLEY